MARKAWALIAMAALLLLCTCPLAAAEEDDPVGWRVQIPTAGLPERLDRVNSGSTADLLALAGGGYTLSMSPLRMGGENWVRAVLMKGSGFFGLCVLGTRQEVAAMKSLVVDIELRQEGALLRFSTPEGSFLAAMELSVDLAGEYRLLPAGQTQGLTVTPMEAPPDDDPAAQPADAPPGDTPAAQEGGSRPPPLRLHPGIYALALLITAAVLAALALGNIHWLRIAALALRIKEGAAALWLHIDARRTLRKPRERPVPAPRQDRQEVPAQGPLPGLRVMETRGEALVRQITMRTAWEAAAEPPPEDFTAQMNEYFLGRAPLPVGGKFLTVGLRNRDALQQLGGNSVRPLFAPNPPGQIFSLEEETGGLYLHADYFAPPSFVLQSVLRSVCLECVFSLEDARGNPLRLENVLGHSILRLAPALTARTEAGFIVTQRGTLVIGEN